jgi:hypothetical protein
MLVGWKRLPAMMQEDTVSTMGWSRYRSNPRYRSLDRCSFHRRLNTRISIIGSLLFLGGGRKRTLSVGLLGWRWRHAAGRCQGREQRDCLNVVHDCKESCFGRKKLEKNEITNVWNERLELKIVEKSVWGRQWADRWVDIYILYLWTSWVEF